MSLRYYAAACQTAFDPPATRAEIKGRTDRMLELAEQAIVGYEPFFDVRLLTFPEFAHSVPIHDEVKQLRKELAIEVPNEHVDRYEALCKKYGCWIQTGTFLEQRSEYPDAVFNTTVLVGPGGVESIYRKVNPWIPWEVQASPHDFEPDGDHFPVADTEIGRIGAAICYDWLFPEVLREMAFKGAEVLCRLSAYMDPWGATPPMDWWPLFNRARAAENMCYVVASNQAAHRDQYPPFSWPGGSMVVDFDGRILAQADPGPGEKVVVAPIDIDALRHERARRMGHDMRSHHRPEAYRYHTSPGLPPIEGELTTDRLRDRIQQSREQQP